jgi:hypothetical protein
MSLKNSFAQENPLRMFIYESTAHGYDMFKDLWDVAVASENQLAIFIGWWRNANYRIHRDDKRFKAYWDNHLSPLEREWVGAVKGLYGFEIDAEQMAWFRWMMQELVGDEQMMMQEHPPTAEYAFIQTGDAFFNLKKVADHEKSIRREKPEYFNFRFGMSFTATSLHESNSKRYSLRVWRHPVKGAFYVVGADPAYGSSDTADRFVIQVYRCYAEGMEHCAEFCSSQINVYQFAWVLSYLCGYYGPSLLNLEVNGPGKLVLTEMDNLRKEMNSTRTVESRDMANVLGYIRSYMWVRPDQGMHGTSSNSRGWITSAATKPRLMNTFKDLFERGMLDVKSPECLEEMKTVIRDGDSIVGSGRNKDDRVIAGALASVAYNEKLRIKLLRTGISRPKSESAELRNTTVADDRASRQVGDLLKRLGVVRTS